MVPQAGHITAAFTGTDKKLLLKVFKLCLQICNDLVFFIVLCITLFEHLLQGSDQIILGTVGCVQS